MHERKRWKNKEWEVTVVDDYRIAVMLSAYNGEKYITKQIESILKQDNADHITLYIRDDGSSDGTLSILQELQDTHSNIRVIQGENVGLVKSFFSLLAMCVGEGYDYYSFSDQDDYWKPEKLNIAVQTLLAADSEKPLMYSSCSELVDDNLQDQDATTQRNLRGITFYNSAIQNFCPGHNQVLNHKLAQLVVNKTTELKNIYSQDLWITNVAAVTGKIYFDNHPHVLYRQHNDNQLSYGKGKMEWIKDHLKRLKKNEGKKIAIQLKQFVSDYKELLSPDEQKEMTSFFKSQRSFIKRLDYVIKSKLYRQKKYETLIFKFLYLTGAYNV